MNEWISNAKGTRKSVRTLNNKHVKQVDNTRMPEGLKNLDLPQSSDWHPLLLVMHQDTLKSYNRAGLFVKRFVYLPI